MDQTEKQKTSRWTREYTNAYYRDYYKKNPDYFRRLDRKRRIDGRIEKCCLRLAKLLQEKAEIQKEELLQVNGASCKKE